MSSTGEVKDNVRLAQQYNVQIYRYLTDGLVSSSLRVSQLRAELEEYTRSSMKVFVRLLEIRNSRLPCDRVREEQINVFREQMKRNDRLRQEVHNVQRGLWRLREMGQRVPMSDKHMIIQGFPELCVSTSPDKVPLTALCDQILNKYNLRNERHIMDMLRWADEQSQARKVARQTPSPPVQETSKPKACPTENIGNDEKKLATSNKVLEDHRSSNVDNVMNEVTPVPSWCDFDQLFPTDNGINEVTPVPSWCDFDQLFPTDNGINEVTPVPSWCDFEEDQPTTMCLQEMVGRCFTKASKELEEGKEPGSELIEGELRDCTVGKETRLIDDTQSYKATSALCREMKVDEGVTEGDDLDELMSALQDIPELEPDYVWPPASTFTTQVSSALCEETKVDEGVREGDDLDELMSALQGIPELEQDYVWPPASTFTTLVSVCSETNSSVLSIAGKNTQSKPTNIALLETQPGFVIADPKLQELTVLKDLYQFKQPTLSVDKTCQEPFDFEKVINPTEPTPGTEQPPGISDEKVPVPNTTKPVLRDLHKLKEIQSTFKESLQEVIAGIIKEKPELDAAKLPTALPTLESIKPRPKVSAHEEANISIQQAQLSTPTDENKVSVYTQKASDAPRGLVGSDKPHVYENKIKRKQHGPSSVIQNMTAGEIVEYEKRRDDALQAVELKKQRTKLLLNQQFEKRSQKNPPAHFYKIQNTPKLKNFNKPAVLPTRAASNNRNNQISKSSSDSTTVLGSSSLSRKRPASSVSTASAPKRARSSRPRIILRIFRDEDDWNVEQVIDRY